MTVALACALLCDATMDNRWLRPSSWAWGLCLLVGCTGDIGDTGDEPGPSPSDVCSADAAFGVPLYRLNVTQYHQVVGELFGSDLAYESSFPPPLTGYPYSTYAAANPVAGSQVQPIMATAESIGMAVADRVPACSGDEPACASSFLTDIAARALRRPPADDELAILMTIYGDARAEMDHAEAVGLAVSGLLQLPQFLYLLEEVPAPGAEPRALDAQEIGQRLALMYGGGLPDADLFAAIDDGSILEPDVRVAHARRLLETPQGTLALKGFLQEWLMVKGFSAPETVHPAELSQALGEQLDRDLDAALSSEDGLSELLVGTRTQVNSVLEEFYGLPSQSSGPDDWREVELDAEQRVGVLTHPVLMARFAHGTSPSDILRGKFVRMSLLCGNIAPPPAGAQQAQAEIAPEGATPREQAQARLDHPTCGGCHHMMDPIGFGFSAFDGAGRYAPDGVDVSGVINSPGEVTGEFQGVRELGELLVAAPEVQSCLATQFVRYSLGKTESAEESCSMDQLSLSLSEESTRLIDMFAALAGAPAFAERASEEVQP